MCNLHWDGRRGLSGRAFAALIIGLAAAGIAAYLITVPLRWAGYGPTTGDLADGGLGVLPTVNVVTVVVAFVAGIAGILAFETRSSSAVGVAISITTIPAAAFAGAAAAVTDWAGATAALAVLAVNIVMLLTRRHDHAADPTSPAPTELTAPLSAGKDCQRAGPGFQAPRPRAAASSSAAWANQYRTLTS